MRPITVLILATSAIAAPALGQSAPQPVQVSSYGNTLETYDDFDSVSDNDVPDHICWSGIDSNIERQQSLGNPSFWVPSSVECGDHALAAEQNSTAIGTESFAVQDATALGHFAYANGVSSTALGTGATASFANSSALGTGAVATAANQVALGGTGSAVRVGDIAASTAAQDPVTVAVATVDGSGVLGRDTALIPTVQALQAASTTQSSQISDVQANVAAQAERLSAVEVSQASLTRSVDALFDRAEVDRHDLRQGIAVATAMEGAPFPSAPGRTSYNMGVATFRGEQAVGLSVMHRMSSDVPFAISASIALAGGANNAARLGVAGEF